MSRLEIILGALFTLSLILNVGLVIYMRGTVVRLLSISEELGDLQEMINSFAQHLQGVYELQTFYGDETLHSLLEHAVSFNEHLDTFEYIYSLTTPEDQKGMPVDDTDEEYSAQEEA